MDVELPLASGQGHWIWYGGRPSLDLVNTVRERWRREIECLVAPADLAAWLVEAGLVAEPPDAGEDDLAAARTLRDAIDRAVVAATAGRAVPRSALAELNAWLEHAAVRPRLVARRGGLALHEQPVSGALEHALASVALDAARMLADAQRGRLRICAAERCGVRFYDRSPAAARKWCSMERCGNVEKVRRHRRRER